MFRKGRFKAEMGKLIADDQLCIHPFVIAELALRVRAVQAHAQRLWRDSATPSGLALY